MLINHIDHIELIVGNSVQAAQFYKHVFGFNICGYAGPETGAAGRMSYLVAQNDIRLILTSPTRSDNDIAAYLARHGEGVRDIAFNVEDTAGVFREAVERGAAPVQQPRTIEGKDGRLVIAKIGAFGQTVHSLIERSDMRQFLPFFRNGASSNVASSPITGLDSIDHFAVAVPEGSAGEWTSHYHKVFGFDLVQEEYTATESSAMNTKVSRSKNRKAILVFVEPAPGKRQSQISEFLIANEGAGVHHIAVNTADIIHTVRRLRENGVPFTRTPSTYYEDLEERVGTIAADARELEELGILVDRDMSGYLLQIFCSHIQTRPTFFFEIIQRMGAEGFGSGNIKALYRALERAQLARGTA